MVTPQKIFQYMNGYHKQHTKYYLSRTQQKHHKPEVISISRIDITSSKRHALRGGDVNLNAIMNQRVVRRQRRSHTLSETNTILLNYFMEKSSKSFTQFNFYQNLYLQFSVVYLQFVQHSQSIKPVLQFASMSPPGLRRRHLQV